MIPDDKKLFQNLTSPGEKKAGSFENQEAREYIVKALKDAFPESSITEETFRVKTVEKSNSTMCYGDNRINAHLFENTGTSGLKAEGKLYCAGYSIRKFKRKKIKGKIVVFKYSSIYHRWLQIKSALKYGASAVIIVSKHRDLIQTGVGFPYDRGPCPIPAICITGSQWKNLKRAPKEIFTIEYNSSFKEVTCSNIIFDSHKILNKGETIVMGAHFDSWFTGAQDNCISVQLLFDMLLALLKDPNKKLKHPLRAIFFDAEEIGLLGSKWHASQNDFSPYKFYLNLEMPVPVKNSRPETLCYSNHKITKQSFSIIKLISSFTLPIPLKIFYKFSDTFPSDIDCFYKKDIPCISTYCPNRFYHTELDLGKYILWRKYPRIGKYKIRKKYPRILKKLLKIIYNVDNQ